MTALLLVLTLLAQQELFEGAPERDYEELLRELEELKRAPLDLNAVDVEQLARLPFLSIVTAYRIVEHRRQNGPYVSLERLLAVEGMDERTLEAIRPYVIAKAKPAPKSFFWGRYRYLDRLDLSPRGEEVYSRTVLNSAGQRAYVVTEKDYEEPELFDYLGYGLVAKLGPRRLAVGSYSLEFARGLVFGSKPAIFSNSTYRLLNGNRGIVPYTSVAEGAGFFGGAYSDSTFVRYTVFYSNLGQDARLDTSGNVTSLDPTGDHIDSLSRSRKNNLREQAAGASIEKTWSLTRVGFGSYYLWYNRDFVPDDSGRSFYGRRMLVAGVNSAYTDNNQHLFAELVRSFANRWAGTGGFVGLYRPFELSLVFNYYGFGYSSPKSSIADRGRAEAVADVAYRMKAMKLGANLEAARSLDSDSTEYELRMRGELPLSPMIFRLQLKREYDEQDVNAVGSAISLGLGLLKKSQIYLRLDDRYLLPMAAGRGIAYCTGLNAQLGWLVLDARYGRFRTDSYDSRIYVYEPDLTGVIKNRCLYGEGSLWFIRAGFELEKLLDLQAKYSIIEKETKEQELGLQLELKL